MLFNQQMYFTRMYHRHEFTADREAVKGQKKPLFASFLAMSERSPFGRTVLSHFQEVNPQCIKRQASVKIWDKFLSRVPAQRRPVPKSNAFA
jgi:hypothetical protein